MYTIIWAVEQECNKCVIPIEQVRNMFVGAIV